MGKSWSFGQEIESILNKKASKWPKMLDNFWDILTLKGAGRQTVDTRSTFGYPWNLCGKIVLFLKGWWRGLQCRSGMNFAAEPAVDWWRKKEWVEVSAGHLQDHAVSQLLESAKRTFPDCEILLVLRFRSNLIRLPSWTIKRVQGVPCVVDLLLWIKWVSINDQLIKTLSILMNSFHFRVESKAVYLSEV